MYFQLIVAIRLQVLEIRNQLSQQILFIYRDSSDFSKLNVDIMTARDTLNYVASY